MIPIIQVWRLIPRWMNPGVLLQSLGSLQPSEVLLPVQCSFLCSQVSVHAENLVIEVLRAFVFIFFLLILNEIPQTYILEECNQCLNVWRYS